MSPEFKVDPKVTSSALAKVTGALVTGLTSFSALKT